MVNHNTVFHTGDYDTPKHALSKDELIARCKELIETKFGTQKPELLADDFAFRFPIVELGKEEFVKAFSAFELEKAFPDMVTHYYGFRLDPRIPGRVWFDTCGEGTHTGPMGGPMAHIKPTNKEVVLPPQAQSFTFNDKGQLTYFTGGYVIDRRMGNTGGLGGVFGIMHAIGKTLPFPEAQPFSLSYRWRLLMLLDRSFKAAKWIADEYVWPTLGYGEKLEGGAERAKAS